MLFEGDGQAFEEWLKPYAEELGAQVLVTDDNESYGVAADGLGLAHQFCVSRTLGSSSSAARSRSWSRPKGSGVTKTTSTRSSERTSID